MRSYLHRVTKRILTGQKNSPGQYALWFIYKLRFQMENINLPGFKALQYSLSPSTSHNETRPSTRTLRSLGTIFFMYVFLIRTKATASEVLCAD